MQTVDSSLAVPVTFKIHDRDNLGFSMEFEDADAGENIDLANYGFRFTHMQSTTQVKVYEMLAEVTENDYLSKDGDTFFYEEMLNELRTIIGTKTGHRLIFEILQPDEIVLPTLIIHIDATKY